MRDVPLLVLDDCRVDFDYGQPLDFGLQTPLESLGMLASTQTGFLPPRSPDFRFPGPLADITALGDDASVVYAREDAHTFQLWLRTEIDALLARVGTPERLIRLAVSLPLPRQERLMVPLIYLNHMWRQGSPTLEPADGPSAMPHAFDALLTALWDSTAILPRFNQVLMSMRAWRIDGHLDAAAVSYRDITDLANVVPAFWFLRDSQAELDLYRGFFLIDSVGAPLHGWACLALECAAQDDIELGVQALHCVYATMRNVYFSLRRILPQIDPGGFRKVQVTGGWIEDELTGVASGYQLPYMQMLDALFGVEYTHPGTVESRTRNLRFVPQRWKDFFRVIHATRPSLATWVRGRECAQLTDAYQRCVDLFTLFRSLHRHLAGPILRGPTTTGRSFPSREANYRQFVSEMASLVTDTAATGVSAAERQGR